VDYYWNQFHWRKSLKFKRVKNTFGFSPQIIFMKTMGSSHTITARARSRNHSRPMYSPLRDYTHVLGIFFHCHGQQASLPSTRTQLVPKNSEIKFALIRGNKTFYDYIFLLHSLHRYWISLIHSPLTRWSCIPTLVNASGWDVNC